MTSYFSRSLGASAFIIAGALLLSVTIVKTGIAGVTRFAAPDVALQWASGDARALATASENTLTENADADVREQAAALARAAIRRDPTLATPFRILGFVAEADGKRPAAKALIEHAERLSRRELGAQLWLIDDAVARTDMAGALHHFDIALRTSTLAPVILFPVLNNAISEPDVVDALATTLAARPSWRDRFLADAIDKSAAIAGLVRLGEQLNRRRSPFDQTQVQQLLNRLTAARAFALIARMRPAVLPATLGQTLLLDPDFDAETGVFPFGWTLFESNGLSARRVPADNGSKGLRLAFEAGMGRGGELLRQSLFLKPGAYRLTWTGTHSAPDALSVPVWTVVCPNLPPVSLLSTAMELGNGAKRGEADFTVPADCPGQWLQLVARPTNSPQGVKGAIERVDIVRH